MVSHRFAQSDARQRAAASKGILPQCGSQAQWLRVKPGYCSPGKLSRKWECKRREFSSERIPVYGCRFLWRLLLRFSCRWQLLFSSASSSPAAPTVLASSISMIELLRSSSTLRSLRSTGSCALGCLSRSMPFNSPRVVSIKTSREMTPPCKVCTWSWQDMARGVASNNGPQAGCL